MEAKIENLKKKKLDAEKVLSNDDDDLRDMFYNLKNGLQNITEKVNNPTYYWNGCNAGTFNSLSDLLKYVDSEHAFQEDQSASALIDKKYKCKWDKCHVEFQKKTLLQNHLRKQHTGQESDIFIKYLIQDQAKALVTPSKQMRWHPLVIKYCLANYRSQSSYDQLSKSSFLKLPLGRLLQYYRQFDKQESGWNYENINQMNQNF